MNIFDFPKGSIMSDIVCQIIWELSPRGLTPVDGGALLRAWQSGHSLIIYLAWKWGKSNCFWGAWLFWWKNWWEAAACWKAVRTLTKVSTLLLPSTRGLGRPEWDPTWVMKRGCSCLSRRDCRVTNRLSRLWSVEVLIDAWSRCRIV